MADSPLISGALLFDTWRDGVFDPTPPTTWNIGAGFDHIEIGPGRIILVGGAPGAGKTALITQWTFDALALNPALRVVVANVEMSPFRLLDRQLARFSGVPLTTIRHHQIGPDDIEPIGKAVVKISQVVPRLGFVKAPYDLDRIADAADNHAADLIVLDYVQRIDSPGRFNGMRERINGLMSFMRLMTDAGVGILAAAALTRSRDSKGRSSYHGKHLSLASFRESSELEYGADDCFLLYPTEENADPAEPVRLMTLNHAKSRDGETKNIVLKFHSRFQLFEDAGPWSMMAEAASASPASTGNRAKAAWANSGGNGTPDGKPF
jgi:replicative DNA helicase